MASLLSFFCFLHKHHHQNFISRFSFNCRVRASSWFEVTFHNEMTSLLFLFSFLGLLQIQINTAQDTTLTHPSVKHLLPRNFTYCSGPITFSNGAPHSFPVPPLSYFQSSLSYHQYIVDSFDSTNSPLSNEYDVSRIANFLQHQESLTLFKRLSFKTTVKNMGR